MTIPIKCFTCGKVLADKYRYYNSEVRKRKMTRDLHVLTNKYINFDFNFIFYFLFVAKRMQPIKN